MAELGNLNAFENDQTKTETSTGRKMRVGIIGTGWIAEAHVGAYLHQPDVEIVAGCDLVPGKAKPFFKKFEQYGLKTEGIKTDYKNDEEMLADKSLKLDCVSVCTYNRQHAPCAIHALNAGINVLLEKPMCVTTEEAIEIIKAEKKSGKVLSIGFQPRFDANMKEIKKIVESGVLGKIYYIQTGG
ncbi:MAG: Gfo/Idh/MocA family oxidoreductase, partial [Clostridia bacterium]|nr:Gfo/Idh/MocA family oxidoreductase [Clostridia bacterium]